jgi:hypothetical protein
LPKVPTSNVLAEAYPTPVAIYLLEYRDHPQHHMKSVFRALAPRGRLASCVTVTHRVAQLAHGQPSEDCPLGAFPSDNDFDNVGEQFYAADAAGEIEHVTFGSPPEGHPPGCFGGRL